MQSFKQYLIEAKLPHDPHLLSYAYANFIQEFLIEFDQTFGSAIQMWGDDNDHVVVRQIIMRGDKIKVSYSPAQTRQLLVGRLWNIAAQVTGGEYSENYETVLFQKAKVPFNDPKFKTFENSDLANVPSGLVSVMHALNLENNHITGGFENLPDHTDILNLRNNKISSLSGFGNSKRSFFQLDLSHNPIQGNILSLLKCDFINELIYEKVPESAQKALTILEKHLKSKNILVCQEELMDNGLKDYAKL